MTLLCSYEEVGRDREKERQGDWKRVRERRRQGESERKRETGREGEREREREREREGGSSLEQLAWGYILYSYHIHYTICILFSV